MTVFRADTSFPYLALSYQLEERYSRVLEITDIIERRYLRGGNAPDLAMLAAYLGISRPKLDAIYFTTKAERERREACRS